MKKNNFTHPYIPNSIPEIQEQMLKEIGADSIEDFFAEVPKNLRFEGSMGITDAAKSEFELTKYMNKILAKNITCEEYTSFLGGGCSNHYVPAVCDEVNQRSEFLTAYAGEAYEDHGRFHSLFEYASMMGDLLEMDVVNVPTYDWSQACSTSIRMAGRITGRNEVLVSNAISPNRKDAIENYCRGTVKITYVNIDPETGHIDLSDLKGKMNDNMAGFYFENPSFMGVVEPNGQLISDIVHDVKGISLVGCAPISLGVLTPPANYGADIVTGDIEALGIHMQYGGGLAGFIATHDDTTFINEYPSRLFSITNTCVEGEYGFGDVLYERTSFGEREHGKEFIGTAAALWGITAGVYLALMGPVGMKDIGNNILDKVAYAKTKISEIDGVNVKYNKSSSFKEFVVDFSQAGITVDEINKKLLKKEMFGGKNISDAFESMNECALYCVTEVHTKEEIDNLANAINEIVNN